MTAPPAGGARRCQVCRWEMRAKRDQARQVCARCQTGITADLGEVEALWAQLAGRIERGTGPAVDPDIPRAPSSGGSRPPGNPAVLNLRAGAVTGALLVHEDDWRRQLRRRDPRWTLTPARGTQDAILAGVLEFLRGNLHWACHALEFDVHVDDLAHDLDRLLDDMRAAATGDHRRPHTLGLPCPLPTDAGVPCGGRLVFEPRHSRIRCKACRQTVPHDRWEDLADAAGLPTTAA